jgi:hypothetical protein
VLTIVALFEEASQSGERRVQHTDTPLIVEFAK